MGRFLANTVNAIDKKGRVSIPASFRGVLGSERSLHTLLSITQPNIEAGGPELIEAAEARLSTMDPFSEEYEVWSFYVHGDADSLKIDGDGRIMLNEQLREHAGITDQVAFVGRGHFFQMWAPERFSKYREEARAKVRAMRDKLGGNKDQNAISEIAGRGGQSG